MPHEILINEGRQELAGELTTLVNASSREPWHLELEVLVPVIRAIAVSDEAKEAHRRFTTFYYSLPFAARNRFFPQFQCVWLRLLRIEYTLGSKEWETQAELARLRRWSR